MARAAETFRRAYDEQVERWSAEFAAARSGPVIWGAGSKGVSFLTTLGAGAGIELAVDVNPYKQDKWLAGLRACAWSRPRRCASTGPTSWSR